MKRPIPVIMGDPGPIQDKGVIAYPSPRTPVSVIPCQPVSTITPWATVVPQDWENNHPTKKNGGISPPVVKTARSRISIFGR